MEPTPRNRRLLGTAQRLGRELGLQLADVISIHTATLDGLGPSGKGDHAVDEHVNLSSIGERTALLALLLLEPAVAANVGDDRPADRLPRPEESAVGGRADARQAQIRVFPDGRWAAALQVRHF